MYTSEEGLQELFHTEAIVSCLNNTTPTREEEVSEVSTYSNPVDSHLLIYVNGSSHINRIKIYNLNGKEEITRDIINNNRISIDVSVLRPGIHIGVMYLESSTRLFKIFKL